MKRCNINMTEVLPQIRNTTRALIRRGDKVLVLKKTSSTSNSRYALPGGGQDSGETLNQALTRECAEEIGTDITINSLVAVSEWLKEKASAAPCKLHTMDFVFSCDVSKSYQPHNGPKPDKRQVDVIWVKASELTSENLSPGYLADFINQPKKNSTPVYLGAQWSEEQDKASLIKASG